MEEDITPTTQDSTNHLDSNLNNKLHKIFNPYTLSGLIVGNIIWGYVIFKRVNRILSMRYSNPVYQIRRPDSISNRLLAFKYFIIGGSIIPMVFLGYTIYNKNTNKLILNPNDKSINSPSSFIYTLNNSLSKYTNNANIRLENLSNNVKDYIPESNFKNMGLDLKKDINKLRSWFSNIF